MADEQTSPLIRRLMVWVLYALPVVVTVQPVGWPKYDPDIWWHLRVGQWVVEHRAVTTTEPFSQLSDTPWVAYSWLYEVLMYGLYSALGLYGIIAYRVGMALAVVAAVHGLVRRLQTNFLLATGLTGVAVLALSPLFSERPWLVTILFAALTLRAVVEIQGWEGVEREGEAPAELDAPRPPWWVWLLPVAYVLWANVHIQFVYGLFILGLAWVCSLVPDADVRSFAPRDRRTIQDRLLFLTALCTAATLINPYGYRVYVVVVEYATQPGPFAFVNELKAMQFREVGDWLILGLTGVTCWALAWRWLGVFPIALLIAASYFAFRSCRDIWFVLLANLLILASVPRLDPEPRDRPGWRSYAVGMVGLVLLAVALAWGRGLTRERLDATVAEVFPVEAAAFVREQGYRGPLYNDFNWGGYLIWALPDLPVAIDGRTNLHGDARIQRFGQVWAGKPGWWDDPDLSRAGVIIAAPDEALVSLLLMDRRFVLVYGDTTAWVFVARWQLEE